MTRPEVEMLAKLLESATDRGFGDAILRNNLATRPLFSPLRTGADNLFGKAVKAATDGDQERAERFVVRLLGLDYDELEECDTALFSAHMAVYSAVTDLLETSDEGDDRWLTASERVVDTGSESARDHVLRALDVVRRDYHVTKAQLGRIEAAQKRHPVPPSDDDTIFVPPGALLPEPDREHYVRGAIEAVVTLGREFEAASS